MKRFYYTSVNARKMAQIVSDYYNDTDITPQEFLKKCMKDMDESMVESKSVWLIETFLGITRHKEFLWKLTQVFADDFSYDERMLLVVFIYCVLFNLDCDHKNSLYKAMYNLSKKLCERFLDFFVSEGCLKSLFKIGCEVYDKSFVTATIIHDYQEWQDSLKDLWEEYDSHRSGVKEANTRKPTIPVDLKVLHRPKKLAKQPSEIKEINVVKLRKTYKRPITCNIKELLKQVSEQNKIRAKKLFSDAQKRLFNCAQNNGKSEKFKKTVEIIEQEKFLQTLVDKPKKIKSSLKPIPTKHTKSTLRRIGHRVETLQRTELEWFDSLFLGSLESKTSEQIEEKIRQENEQKRMKLIEEKHLKGLLSYEEAVIAKQKVLKENKKKFLTFMKEKEEWDKKLKAWYDEETNRVRKNIEKAQSILVGATDAKKQTLEKKHSIAKATKEESENLIKAAIKVKVEELEKRKNLINEMKALNMLAKEAKMKKVVDLTATSGLPLFTEMSIVELQERLVAMRIEMREEVEKRRSTIRQGKQKEAKELEDLKSNVETYAADKARQNKETKKNDHSLSKGDASIEKLDEEIIKLKMELEEKRKLRNKLTKVKSNL